MTLLRLILEFMKTGLFSVGGGLATLPFLYEMSDRTGGFSHADIADMIAVSESTPGPIGINMSTYAGFRTAGVLGGILASMGLAAPSIIISLTKSFMMLSRFTAIRLNIFFTGLINALNILACWISTGTHLKVQRLILLIARSLIVTSMLLSKLLFMV